MVKRRSTTSRAFDEEALESAYDINTDWLTACETEPPKASFGMGGRKPASCAPAAP
jgi:hypothetical protein